MGDAEEQRMPQRGLLQRGKMSLNTRLRKRGWSSHSRALVFHYSNLIWEQVTAVVPISLIQVLVLAIFFRKTSATPGMDAAGLLSAIAGLVLFLEGLRVAIMPMALLVGAQLPIRLKLPLVLVVAFLLGVLVTYAEPAIAAIRPLAKLVDPQNAPYLYYMMNQQQELLVLAIGLGVGLASVVGTLKFLNGISIKPFIAAALLPTVGLACYMQWGNPALAPILGVAWDCGGVTTGPVTVPILLSLGVGVMKAQRQKQMALAVLEDAAIKQSEGNTLEGFGIVTLASLLPVLAVELMAIITGATHSYEYVSEQASLAHQQSQLTTPAAADTSPLKEVIFGIRAICPLLAALLLLVLLVLRQDLPTTGFAVDGVLEDSDSSSSSDDGLDLSSSRRKRRRDDSAYAEFECNVINKVHTSTTTATTASSSSSSSSSGADITPARDDDDLAKDVEAGTAAAAAAAVAAAASHGTGSEYPCMQSKLSPARRSPAAAAAAAAAAGDKRHHILLQQQQQQRSPHVVAKVAAAVVVAAGEGDTQDYFEGGTSALDAPMPSWASGSGTNLGPPLLSPDVQGNLPFEASAASGTAAAAAAAAAAGGGGSSGVVLCWLRRNRSLLCAMIMCQTGMILFNIGLTYG